MDLETLPSGPVMDMAKKTDLGPLCTIIPQAITTISFLTVGTDFTIRRIMGNGASRLRMRTLIRIRVRNTLDLKIHAVDMATGCARCQQISQTTRIHRTSSNIKRFLFKSTACWQRLPKIAIFDYFFIWISNEEELVTL